MLTRPHYSQIKSRRPLVFTNGVFDILHRGHVEYLKEARKLGSGLVVAINSDASARRLNKGYGRPLNKAEDRAAVLLALECVDEVIFFEEDTPCEVLKIVRPEIYVKGGDYDIDSLPETALVRSWGGNALSIPLLEGYSTTSLVDRIRAVESEWRQEHE